MLPSCHGENDMGRNDIYHTELEGEAFDRLWECLPPIARWSSPEDPGENLIHFFPGGKVIIARKEDQ